uniref:Uncharacterized protein n=1 Tax=Arundo donax TaxID=35708 RepID=A0A0A9BNZ3_ARUDO
MRISRPPLGARFLCSMKLVMFPDQYASYIQAFPKDAELINKDIPLFMQMVKLFGGSMMHVLRRR